MKDLLNKLGLKEFFAYLCPGIVLLGSLLLWLDPNPEKVLGTEVARQQLVVALLLVVVAYALGFVVSWWSNREAERYDHLRFNKSHADRVRRVPAIARLRGQERRQFLRRNSYGWKGTFKDYLRYWYLCCFFSVPGPRLAGNDAGEAPLSNDSMIRSLCKVSAGLESRSGFLNLSARQTRWEFLATYRAIVADASGEEGRNVLAEAETAHRHFLFALGVATASLLVAAQAVLRLSICGFVRIVLDEACACWAPSLPEIHPITLGVIATVGTLVNLALRFAAVRWWEQELILTGALAHAVENPPSPGPDC